MQAEFNAINNYFGPHTSASGTNIVSVSSAGPAALVGVYALNQGASVVDSVLATALTQIALVAGSYVSYAGYLELVYFDVATNQSYLLNAGFRDVPGNNVSEILAGNGLGEPTYTNASKPFPLGASVLVPGFMRGVEAASARFGAIPFCNLFDAAISFTESPGFNRSSSLGYAAKMATRTLQRTPEGAALLRALQPAPADSRRRDRSDGGSGGGGRRQRTTTRGAVLQQPQVAALLREVAQSGSADPMYSGQWAQAAVRAVRAYGGNLTLADMAAYAPVWSTPSAASVAGHTLYSTQDGGPQLLEAVLILEASGLAEQQQQQQASVPPSEDPETLSLLGLVVQWCTVLSDAELVGAHLVTFLTSRPALRSIFPAPVWSVAALQAVRVTAGHAQRVWSLIHASPSAFAATLSGLYTATATATAGSSGSSSYEEEESLPRTTAYPSSEPAASAHSSLMRRLMRQAAEAGRGGKHSAVIVARDAAGNVASMMHSINAQGWGSGIVVQGVALPNAGSINQFQLRWKKPSGSAPLFMIHQPVCPVIALANSDSGAPVVARPLLSLAVIGDSLVPGSVQMLAAMLLWGGTPQQALNAPQLHLGPPPSSPAACANRLPISVVRHVNCSQPPFSGDPYCSFAQRQFPGFTSAFLDALPLWMSECVTTYGPTALSGGHTAPAAALQYNPATASATAATSPFLNGLAVGNGL